MPALLPALGIFTRQKSSVSVEGTSAVVQAPCPRAVCRACVLHWPQALSAPVKRTGFLLLVGLTALPTVLPCVSFVAVIRQFCLLMNVCLGKLA